MQRLDIAFSQRGGLAFVLLGRVPVLFSHKKLSSSCLGRGVRETVTRDYESLPS
jgi:hypothetical protein